MTNKPFATQPTNATGGDIVIQLPDVITPQMWTQYRSGQHSYRVVARMRGVSPDATVERFAGARKLLRDGHVKIIGDMPPLVALWIDIGKGTDIEGLPPSIAAFVAKYIGERVEARHRSIKNTLWVAYLWVYVAIGSVRIRLSNRVVRR